ncbi:MAG: hypothetical protein Q7K03_05890, partial [Dehalococcoidia bacterium]|nr:hypothetical protein [Dehalococcoidia bacterium]
MSKLFKQTKWAGFAGIAASLFLILAACGQATPPLATITILPNPSFLAVNTSQQLTATGTDTSGNTVAVSPMWSVEAGGGITEAGGGTIDSTGLFTAGPVAGTFPNAVRATIGTVSGYATIVVIAAG